MCAKQLSRYIGNVGNVRTVSNIGNVRILGTEVTLLDARMIDAEKAL